MMSQCYQKINHALANLFKNPPVNPEVALDCMDEITQIGRINSAFFSLLSKQIQRLYTWATTGDKLTANQAKTKLLFSFSQIAPHTIEEKNQLLYSIQRMPDLKERQSEISKVLETSAFHYEQNRQYVEDPHGTFLVPMADILTKLCTGKRRFSNSGESNEQKWRLFKCTMVIAAHAPHLFNEEWARVLEIGKRSGHCAQPILEAPVVPPRFTQMPRLR